MFKWLAIGVAVLLPCIAQARKAAPAEQEADKADKMVCVDKDQTAPTAPEGKKAKKAKADSFKDQVVPLALVVCEVENALDAYQQSKDVDDNTLPKILSADFDFKTVVDTKGSLGIGLFIFKILGGSIDKQKTDEVDFQYVPKSLLRTAIEARKAQTFQDELVAVITNAATAVKQQNSLPARPGDNDPLVFKQLSVSVSFGVTKAVQAGVSVPINIVTLTAELDHSKNSVQQVKLIFGPPPKPKEDTKGE